MSASLSQMKWVKVENNCSFVGEIKGYGAWRYIKKNGKSSKIRTIYPHAVFRFNSFPDIKHYEIKGDYIITPIKDRAVIKVANQCVQQQCPSLALIQDLKAQIEILTNRITQLEIRADGSTQNPILSLPISPNEIANQSDIHSGHLNDDLTQVPSNLLPKTFTIETVSICNSPVVITLEEEEHTDELFSPIMRPSEVSTKLPPKKKKKKKNKSKVSNQQSFPFDNPFTEDELLEQIAQMEKEQQELDALVDAQVKAIKGSS